MDLKDRRHLLAELADSSILVARLLNPPPQGGAESAPGCSHALLSSQPGAGGAAGLAARWLRRRATWFRSRAKAALPLLQAEAAHGMFAWAAGPGPDSAGKARAKLSCMLATPAAPWWNWMPSVHALIEVAAAMARPCGGLAE
jgi:hypothetical protein